jgi:hypothetical protein
VDAARPASVATPEAADAQGMMGVRSFLVVILTCIVVIAAAIVLGVTVLEPRDVWTFRA